MHRRSVATVGGSNFRSVLQRICTFEVSSQRGVTAATTQLRASSRQVSLSPSSYLSCPYTHTHTRSHFQHSLILHPTLPTTHTRSYTIFHLSRPLTHPLVMTALPSMTTLVLLMLVVLTVVADVVSAGGPGTAALYSSTACYGSAVGIESNLPTDGTCFAISGFNHFQSGTLQCNSASGQVMGTLYTDGSCGIVAASGSGVGDGATCITLYNGNMAEAGSKINCGAGGAGGGGGGSDGGASTWTGTYRAGGQCNQASCCCMTGVIAVSESGSSAVVSAGVTGQCGSATQTSLVVPYPTSNTFTTTLPGGDQATFTLSSDGTTITEVDTSSPQCGGTATRLSNVL